MNSILRILLLAILTTCGSLKKANTQAPPRLNSSEIFAGIQKLQVLGSALYIAAHPDDENTRMISHLSNVEKVETAYLSLTRGDGGQNLIASDIRELLGLTRTQELLAARRIDGGVQFFSRANDFGYSKHPDETFNIWARDSVLADVVWVIRNWQPDVIVLRFDPRAPGTTHGHHTASGILGLEAFELAADPNAFPEQLQFVDTWQTKRIYWNAYTWRRDLAENIVPENLIEVGMGTYLPERGESVAEIAARSRSMHKSQGFGSSGRRDNYTEQLELLAGDGKGENDDPFAGIEMSWDRIEGGRRIGEALARIETEFDLSNPVASVPDLLGVMLMIESLPRSRYVESKMTEVEELIAAAMGLYVSATVDETYAVPGDSLKVNLEVTNRSNITAKLTAAALVNFEPMQPLQDREDLDENLLQYEPVELELKGQIPDIQPYSSPYWLQEPWELGVYTVSDQLKRGKGESDDPFHAFVRIDIAHEGANYELIFSRPVRFSKTDPVDGEVFQPFEVLPQATVEIKSSSFLFPDKESQVVEVKVSAGRAGIFGELQLCHPDTWTVEPENYAVNLSRKGEEAVFRFELTPPDGASEGMIVPLLEIGGDSYTDKLVVIEHDHIPTQYAVLDASVPVVKLDLETQGQNIGYVMGAGDEIPAALRQIGYDVSLLEDEELSSGDLSGYDAIIVGIRAYNTLERMANYNPRLLAYAEQGGTLIVQYNTTWRLKIPQEEISPFPLTLSRDRVTVEEAEVRILEPGHPALTRPNQITAADFEGWVQERGLYFPNEWGDEFTPLLSSNDPGEPARNGGLLVAEYGSGYYVYTGYSFFRELPAGVPGAYRLFANLIALGNDTKR
ncbi:MAG: PIG-L family deacetylase [Bacteroidota bacterium]